MHGPAHRCCRCISSSTLRGKSTPCLLQVPSAKKDAKISREVGSASADLQGSPLIDATEQGRNEGKLVVHALTNSVNSCAVSGIHAYEKRMPIRLNALLSQNDTIKHAVSGLVVVLEDLLKQDKNVAAARLCHPGVQYVGKLKHGFRGEGFNFCGYHNIQMQISYIRSAQTSGHEHFSSGIPSILRIQDIIESAWDKGINVRGRIETGGIRGTRKYIGPLEASTFFAVMDIPTVGDEIQSHKDGTTAFEQLLMYVDKHFSSGHSPVRSTVFCTSRPPIYLQRPGHSMTIVGIETSTTGGRSLLAFDPSELTSRSIQRGISKRVEPQRAQEVLNLFRRGAARLKRCPGFELLHAV